MGGRNREWIKHWRTGLRKALVSRWDIVWGKCVLTQGKCDGSVTLRKSHPVLNRKCMALCVAGPCSLVSRSERVLILILAVPVLSRPGHEADGGCGDTECGVWCVAPGEACGVMWTHGCVCVWVRRGMQCWAVIGFGAGGCDSRRAGDRLERERPATLGEERDTKWPSAFFAEGKSVFVFKSVFLGSLTQFHYFHVSLSRFNVCACASGTLWLSFHVFEHLPFDRRETIFFSRNCE